MVNNLRHSTSADAENFRLAWTELPADLLTPVRGFLALRAAGRHLCLLESAEGPDRIARWSFLGVDPQAKVMLGSSQSNLDINGGEEILVGSPQKVLQGLVEKHAQPDAPDSLPPFRGGWIGWLSYEWASQLEPSVGVAAKPHWDLPLGEFHLYSTVIAFDHATQRVVLMSACPNGAKDFDAAECALGKLAEQLGGQPDAETEFSLGAGELRSSMCEEEYVAGVKFLKESIASGDIFQAVLSQRFEQEFSGDSFSLYRALRLTNPSPHMFYFGGDDVTLVGSSPERLVSVEGRKVQNRPIAGTRARSDDTDKDDLLAAELMSDQKERAEHDMLVDLGRNDLGRIARAGTVQVKEHAALEKFAKVQHLVSRVECELAVNKTALDALAASFPAGTVSGAPKVKAIDLLSKIEPETRGPYAGCFGYLDTSGNLDMAISIRTFVICGDTVSVQVGAGVVHDSSPEREFTETIEKSQALLEALKCASSGVFGGSK